MRVYLHGEGEPIPIQALPDELPVSDLPPLSFQFDAPAEFPVEDYRSLGYTNFEAICIGAAGGRGGDSKTQLIYEVENTSVSVPQWLWDLVLERAMNEDYLKQRALGFDLYYNDPNFYNPSGWPPGWVRAYGINPPNRMFTPEMDRWYPSTTTYSGAFPYMLTDDTRHFRYNNIITELVASGFNVSALTAAYPAGFTYKQVIEFFNPTHKLTFKAIKNVRIGGTVGALGGAGGGGGRHVVAGLLSDLPDVVPIMVGVVGADAEPGQTIQSGLMTPALSDPQFSTLGGPYSHYVNVESESSPYQRRIYEISNIITDFTVSYPDPHPSFPNPTNGQDGGASTFGDVAKASGGKGGVVSYGWPGGVKTFLGYGGDGGLGDSPVAGGGGAGSMAAGIPGADGSWNLATGIGGGGGGGLSGSSGPLRASSSGGRGSYSFADPSKYGPRQQKNGLFGGGGGGALLVPTVPPRYYGSKALASNPNGAVFLRLSKVD